MRVLVLITLCLVAAKCDSSRIPRDIPEGQYGAPPVQTRPVEVEAGYSYPRPDIQTRPIFKDPEPITESPIIPIQTRPLFNSNVIPLHVTTAPNVIQTRPIYNQPQNNLVQTRPIIYEPQPNVIQTRPIYNPSQQTYIQTKPIIYTPPPSSYIQTRPIYNPPQINLVETRPIYNPPQANLIETRPIYNPPQVNYIETRPIYYQPPRPVYNPPQNNFIQTRPIYNPPPPSFVQTRPIYNKVRPNPINDAVEVVASISNEASEKFLRPLFNAISGGLSNNNYPQYPGTNTIGYPGGNGNYPGNYPSFPSYPNYPNYPNTNYPNNNPIFNKFPFLAGLFPNNNNNYNYQRYAIPQTIIPIPAATDGGNFGQVDISINGVNSLGDGVGVNEIPSLEPQGYDYPKPNFNQQPPFELPSGLQFRNLPSEDETTH